MRNTSFFYFCSLIGLSVNKSWLLKLEKILNYFSASLAIKIELNRTRSVFPSLLSRSNRLLLAVSVISVQMPIERLLFKELKYGTT